MLLLHALTMRGNHVTSLVNFCPTVYSTCISLIIRPGFFIPKQSERSTYMYVDRSCKTDLDLLDCFGRENSIL